MTTQGTVENTPLSKLRKAPYMKRTVLDKDKLKELGESIEKHGVLENLIGRKKNGGVEVVAGNRRWAAADLAGLKSVPVLILDLTDEEAKDICAIENLQREDLDPIDEAESIGELLENNTAEEVAGRINKSVSYIQQRIRLLNLSQTGRKWVRDGKITVPAAVALARLEDKAAQDAILERIGETQDPIDAGRMQGAVEREMLELAKAPFDIKDKNLVPEAGSCTQCPKRSGNQFSLPGIDAKVNKDRCTDPQCFRGKLDAKWKLDIVRAKESGLTVIPDKVANGMFSPYGGWTDEGKKEWVDVDRDYHGSETIREALQRLKIETKPEQQSIVRDPTGYGHLILPRSLVKKLLKEDKTKTESEIEHAKMQSEQRARARLVFAVNEEALESMAKVTVSDPEMVVRFATLSLMEQTFLSDEMWHGYGFKTDHNTLMGRVVAGKVGLSDMARIVAIITQRPNKKHTAYSESFQAMCDAFAIEVAELEAKIQNAPKKSKNK